MNDPIPHSARENCEAIIESTSQKLRQKYEHGQREHNTDFATAGLGWYLKEAEAEALDQVSYLHQAADCMERLRDLQERMASGAMHMADAAAELFDIISDTPPRKREEKKSDEQG